ncbi:MAG: thiamine pyrophosphate-dependent dehydrogenase E1 component subunit alpha [Opitutales bacterium]|nr:thiamine pyrophosphate-dependent dehydrogenase E1 component subunit alpha [Opitutales bacterium]
MDQETKYELLHSMLFIRLVEEKIAEKYSENQMRCPVHLSIGQEAIASGVCAHLSPNDKLISAHRSHAHYLAAGGDLKAMLCELYGKIDGCAKGKGGSMHLIDLEAGLISAVPIVGSSIAIGTGVAWSNRIQKLDGIVAIFLGDGATEEGVFSESLDFAALHDLKVLFVCENNHYSVYTHISERQHSKRSICDIARAHGITSFSAEGNEVVEVYDLTKEALSFMNDNACPVLVEFSTFRWREHCGPNWDDDLGYRKDGELKNWMDKCSIKSLRDNLGISDTRYLNLVNELNEMILDAFKHAESSQFPNESELVSDVYA